MSSFKSHTICFVLLILIYKCSSQSGITYHSPINSQQYMYLEEGKSVEVYCFGETLRNLRFPSHTRVVYVQSVFLVNCLPTKVSYVKEMNHLNIRLEAAKIFNLHTGVVPIAAHLEGLTVENLSLSFDFTKTTTQVDLNFITSLVNLTELEVAHTDLYPLPDMKIEKLKLRFGKSLGPWGGMVNIRKLELTSWNVEMVPENWLVNCSLLTSLTVTKYKNLTEPLLKKVIEGVGSLQELIITMSRLGKVPKDLFPYMPKLKRLELSDFYMGGNITLNDFQFKLLSYLDLRNNKIVQLQGLPVTSGPNLDLDISGNKIEDFQLSNLDYKLLKHKESVRIKTERITLKCDCEHGWLALAVRERHLNLTGQMACINGDEISTITNDMVECDRFACGNCTCRRRWSAKATDAYCSGNTTRIPHVRNLRALFAADNGISTITSNDIPETLLTLDLSRNRVSNMDKDTLEALFNVSDRIVHLAGNPFVCDCVTQSLLKALQEYQFQVADYDNITCFGDGRTRRLSEIDINDLCFWEQQMLRTVASAVSAAFIGIVAITGALVFRYRQQIKVFLYARGCCLQWLHEEEIDSNRRYDAFVSFSHQDEKFVMDKLLPILDTEYKLCLHFRDWIVGEFIPAQITRSVEQSKRTVIVLSRKFVESVWGLLEFRTAHITAVQEGRARIILVVLDDVINDENLDGELRSYIRNNTYVRWGDKWFWDKLRYAMPHRRGPPSQPVNHQPVVANHHELPAIMMAPEVQLQIAGVPEANPEYHVTMT